VPEKVAAIADSIRDTGVTVDVEEHGDTIVLREHHCPYSAVVSEHPECCTAIHTMLDDVIATDIKQTDSLATGGASCRFEVAVTSTR
jgi:predicted ArsR family transcriptional regulator